MYTKIRRSFRRLFAGPCRFTSIGTPIGSESPVSDKTDQNRAERLLDRIQSLGKSDEVSDLYAEISAMGYRNANICDASGLSDRVLSRHLSAARVRAALRAEGVKLTGSRIGLAAHGLIRPGDAAVVAEKIRAGLTLREAIDEVSGQTFGLYDRPAVVFQAAVDAAGGLPFALTVLCDATASLAFETDAASLRAGGATISAVIDALLAIEQRLQEMEN